MKLQIPSAVLAQTFHHLRSCGGGRRECQALWVGPWAHPSLVSEVRHPRHTASAVGFQVDHDWLTAFWLRLADTASGVRVQVHTHPGAAYHSATDDAFPLIHTPGYLSLVIPRFATGPADFTDAFLAEIQPDGRFREVDIPTVLEIV